MLAENMKVTTEEILSSREVRRTILRQITENMKDALVEWKEKRQAERERQEDAMTELRTALDSGRAALKGEAGTLRQEAISALEDISKTRLERSTLLRNQLCNTMQAGRKQLQELLYEQGKTRAKDASLLRGELHKNREKVQHEAWGLIRTTKQFLVNTKYVRELKGNELHRSLHMSLEGMRQAVGQTRSMLKDDVARARASWQQAASINLASSTMPTGTLKIANTTVKEPALTKSPPEATRGLADNIFFYIADHPDGISTRQLEEQLNMNHFKVMRALRSLKEEGKVQKKEGLYFAR